MADQSQLAEVRFTRYGISIYGILAKMSRDSVAVRLQTLPARMDVFNPGTDAELVAVTRAGVFVTKTQVASQKAGDLLLSVTAPLKKLQRRDGARLPCDLTVNYRAVHPGGCFGAWHDAAATDISMGGMHLVIRRHEEIPKRMELRFLIPFSENASRMTSRSYSNDAHGNPDERPVKATARLAHARPMPDDLVSLGVAFQVLLPNDKIRLAHFINESKPENLTRFA